MLLTEYLVGRREVGTEQEVLCLVVDSVLPKDLKAGRAEIVRKLNRQDLILEFVSESEPVEWFNFPDLPADVIEALNSGKKIPVVDASDETFVLASIPSTSDPDVAQAQG